MSFRPPVTCLRPACVNRRARDVGRYWLSGFRCESANRLFRDCVDVVLSLLSNCDSFAICIHEADGMWCQPEDPLNYASDCYGSESEGVGIYNNST